LRPSFFPGVSAGLLLAAALLVPAAAADGVYRWTDAQGRVHYGDRPVAGADSLAIRAFDPARQRYRVVKVPDGDTVYLKNGDKIRLLGINTPEVAHRNRPGEPGGEEAGEALRERVLGQRVRLERDVEKKDNYGRKLAHLYDDDGENLNLWLVEQGLAFVFLHPPNLKHAETYLAAEVGARAARRGLWALPRYQVQAMSAAKGYRNSFRRLRGTLARVRHKRKYSYLEFSDGLTASIPKRYLASFKAAGLDPDELVGQTLVLRGWVRRYRGKPSMFLNYPRQIEDLGAVGR
jgi:micrococcal nuclease